jgi:Kef-type K+ transport system membrane component KefB
MAAVGGSATLVAVLGVVAPMLLGLGVSQGFLGGHHVLTHWFVGATLSATSVGITARVLGDLGKATSVEGRIILGAAVIDDVLGLIVLAVVTGLIEAANAGRAFDAMGLAVIIGKAVGFLLLAVVVGRWLSSVTFRFAARLPGEGLLLSFGVAFCFFTAFLAGKAGLAPIVGAFAAGLVLEDVHYQALRERDPQKRDLSHLLAPIGALLVPVFFVLMGMGVDLSVFAQPGVMGFAGALTLAAVLGKQVCSLGVWGPGVDRLAIGLGMIPRGEVGLIFASIGRTLTIGGVRVVDDMVYSACGRDGGDHDAGDAAAAGVAHEAAALLTLRASGGRARPKREPPRARGPRGLLEADSVTSVVIAVTATAILVVPASMTTSGVLVLRDEHGARTMTRVVLPVTRRHHQHALRHAAHVHRPPRSTPAVRAVPVAAVQAPPCVVGAEHVVRAAVVVHHVHVVHVDDARFGAENGRRC